MGSQELSSVWTFEVRFLGIRPWCQGSLGNSAVLLWCLLFALLAQDWTYAACPDLFLTSLCGHLSLARLKAPGGQQQLGLLSLCIFREGSPVATPDKIEALIKFEFQKHNE